MRISDWSSDVFSSDLLRAVARRRRTAQPQLLRTRVQPMRQPDAMRLDPVDAERLQVIERGVEHMHLAEGAARIVEPARAGVDREPRFRRTRRVHFTVTIES